MVSVSDIENGRYYWETVNPHANNTETAYDFIKNELPESIEVYFQDANYLELKLEDGRYFSATVFGNGDFTHHQVEFDFIK